MGTPYQSNQLNYLPQRRDFLKSAGLLATGLCLTNPGALWSADTSGGLRVATFCCDVTPPLGQPMFSCDPLQKIEEPLLAKGIIIEAGKERYVICALDWCELCNNSHENMRKRLAAAAGTNPSHVAIQTLHQHTAPMVDIDAQKVLVEHGVANAHITPAVLEDIEKRLASAVQQATKNFKPFDSIGVGQAKVERVASNRRIRDAEGKIRPRMSGAGGDPVMRELPEGLVDPYVKTITLAQGDKPLVRLHYYATHPQTRYSDGRATSDFVGEAREELQKKEGVFQIYFTGCGGDLTVGKYNDRSDGAREALKSRLLAGMEASVAATKYTKAESVCWRVCPVVFPVRTDKGFSMEDSLALVKDPQALPVYKFYQGALRVVLHKRANKPFELSSLQIGNVYIVHLPGEPLLDFQFFAQSVRQNSFVAVAGYGDCGTGYICPAAEYILGGYEPTDSNVKPESEVLVKQAILELLGVKLTGK